jgi:hypothetical protein
MRASVAIRLLRYDPWGHLDDCGGAVPSGRVWNPPRRTCPCTRITVFRFGSATLNQRTTAGGTSRPQRGRGRVGAIPLRVRLRRAPPSASRPQCQSRLENLGDTSAITVRPLGERMLFSAGYSRLLATSVDVTGVYKGDLILSPPAYSFYPHPHQPDPYHRAGCPWYNAENRRP